VDKSVYIYNTKEPTDNVTCVILCINGSTTGRLLSTKKIRPRRTRPSSGNPLRTLHEHGLTVDEYKEVRTDVAQRELKRIKHEQSMYVLWLNG